MFLANRRSWLALALTVCVSSLSFPALAAPQVPPPVQTHATETAQAPEAAIHPDFEKDGIQVYRLPSGQTLYIKEMHDQPIVTIDTWVETGSVNEDELTNGVSHFLEHLLFKGTDKYGVGEIERLIESKGATFNAATSDDFTHYYITIASPFFEEALNLHANMLLKAAIPPEELERERKVVQEEINRALDKPQRKLMIALTKQLFGDHGYALDTLGPKELIGSVPRKRILDYYHHWYQPKNMHTIIVGDVNPAQAVELVKTAFPADHFPGGGKALDGYTPPHVGLAKGPDALQVSILEDPNISQSYVALAFLGPSIQEREKTYALDVGMLALGSGRSSRLFRRLKEETSLVQSISAGNWTQKHAGLVYVMAEVPTEKRDEAKAEILRTLLTTMKAGITPEELEKAKTQTIKDFIFLNESTDGVARTLGYNVTIGNLEDYTDYVGKIQNVGLDEVQQALETYIDFDRAVWVEMVPEGAVAIDQAEAETRELLMAAAEGRLNGEIVRRVEEQQTGETDVEVVRKVLPNGMTVLFKPRKTSDTMALKLFVRGGRAVEDLPGVSSLLARMLKKGTLARTPEAINAELERQAMGLSVDANEDYMEVSGNAIAQDMGELFLVLQDILSQPAFDETEFAKEKEHLRKALQTSRDQPSAIALENLSLSLYPSHPYGNIGKRVEAHLDAITTEHLASYFETYFIPENMVVSAVGNFDPQVLERYLVAAFPESVNRRSAIAEKPVTITEVPPLEETRIVSESKTQQAATWIAQGWLGPTAVSEDYVPMKVLNSLLGTGMSSRLFTNLREKQGLAYVVTSFFPSYQDKGRFVLYIGTDPKNRARVVEGFQKEIEKLRTQPVSDQELQEAKNKLSGAFALAHETNASQAFYLGFYEVMGLGYEFDNRYPELIQQVSPEEIMDVARKYFTQPTVISIVAPGEEEGASHNEIKPEESPETP